MLWIESCHYDVTDSVKMAPCREVLIYHFITNITLQVKRDLFDILKTKNSEENCHIWTRDLIKRSSDLSASISVSKDIAPEDSVPYLNGLRILRKT